jgi:NADH-quinone oxidoreductase subunit H
VVLCSGSLQLDQIIDQQANTGHWFAFSQPLGMFVFVVAAFAEAARLPFDLPEAEQELVGGYHTEYGGMRLMLLLTAEFIHMITAAFLIVILFLGGWHLWGVTGAGGDVGWITAIVRLVVLMAKILMVVFLFMLVRWTWPRFRYDQLMALAWKIMLPLGIVNLIAVASLAEFGAGLPTGAKIAVGWVVAVAAGVIVAIAGTQVTDNRPQSDGSARGS